MKLEKISKLCLLIPVALAVVCFLLFYLVDYNNYDFDGKNVSPAMTDVIMVFMYLLFFVTAGITVWSLVHGARLNSGNNGPSPTGIPSGKVLAATWGTFIVAIVIGALCGIGSEEFTTNSGETTSAFMVGMVEMFIIAIYILFAVTVIATIVSMTGVLNKSAMPKE